MKTGLLLTTLVLAVLAFTAGSASIVQAMGAPDNNLITETPASDNATPILPTVNYVWQGSSQQPAGTSPSVTAEFRAESASGGSQVTGNENWYFDIDINMPGWLYIAEYYPDPSGLQARWIAYKWQLEQSGVWRLGPFTPAASEPDGRHAYRVWFFSDGRWAADTGVVIYWTYARGAAPVQQPASPVTPRTPTTTENISQFFTNPIVLLLGPSVIVVIVLVSIRLARRQRREKLPKPAAAEEQEPPPLESIVEEMPAPAAPTIARAVLLLPNGMKIKMYGESLKLGRADLARALSLDELVLISRQHLEVTCSDDRCQVEDTGSDNGTRLNGEEIREKGPQELKEGDIIEPAGVVKIKFQVP